MASKSMWATFALLCAVYVGLIVTHHNADLGVLEWVVKAAPMFVLVLNTSKRRHKFLFWALLFGTGGDIALTFDGDAAFQAGLGLFLIGHLFYIFYFFKEPSFTIPRMAGSVVAASASFYIRSLLIIPGDLSVPVNIYITVLTLVMVSTFVGTRHKMLPGALGSVVFAVSDSILALNKFNFPLINLHQYVMVLYYSSQALLFSSKRD